MIQMVDTNLLYIVVTIGVAAAGIIVTQFWNSKMRKDRIAEKRVTQQFEIDKAMREKKAEEKETADSLAHNTAELALATKQDMKDHIDRLIQTLKGDIELQRVLTYSRIDALDTKVAQVKIDLMQHIIDEKEDRIRMQRSIDFIQTLQFGPEAKSIPAYATGEIETQEQRDEPEKGVFATRKDTTFEKKDS